jgi:hypothetical protein
VKTKPKKCGKISAFPFPSHYYSGMPCYPPRSERTFIPVYKTGNNVALHATSSLSACNSKLITPGEIPEEIQAPEALGHIRRLLT